MFFVGKIDKNIYSCISNTIISDDVIITHNQINHIIERHPNDFEIFSKYFADIVGNPDYIIESNKKDTAVILKEIVEENRKVQLILKLATNETTEGYKSSIITFMRVNDQRWARYLRTKKYFTNENRFVNINIQYKRVL